MLSQDNANAFDHEPVFQVIDPFHFNSVVFSNLITNIYTDFAGFAPVHRDISRLVFFTVIDAIGFWTVGGTEMTIGF
jgi:hypothetical protein